MRKDGSLTGRLNPIITSLPLKGSNLTKIFMFPLSEVTPSSINVDEVIDF